MRHGPIPTVRRLTRCETPDGPVILASNHRSFLDSIFIPLLVPRRVTFVAKAEYFDDPKTAWFFRGVGQIPIRREGGSASERALFAGGRGNVNQGYENLRKACGVDLLGRVTQPVKLIACKHQRRRSPSGEPIHVPVKRVSR